MGRGGFTWFEVLFTVVLLVIAIIAVSALMTQQMAHLRRNADDAVIREAAVAEYERIRTMRWDQIDGVNGDLPQSPDPQGWIFTAGLAGLPRARGLVCIRDYLNQPTIREVSVTTVVDRTLTPVTSCSWPGAAGSPRQGVFTLRVVIAKGGLTPPPP